MPLLDPAGSGSGLQLRDVVSADFNGDGRPDTDTVNEGRERVAWQWLTGTD